MIMSVITATKWVILTLGSLEVVMIWTLRETFLKIFSKKSKKLNFNYRGDPFKSMFDDDDEFFKNFGNISGDPQFSSFSSSSNMGRGGSTTSVKTSTVTV